MVFATTSTRLLNVGDWVKKKSRECRGGSGRAARVTTSAVPGQRPGAHRCRAKGLGFVSWHRTGPHSVGQAAQNTNIERFNRAYRTEMLDRYVFASPDEVRRVTEDWRHRHNHHNHHRAHRALGGLPPARFALA